MPTCVGTRWRRLRFDIGPRARCSVVGSENIRCVGTEVAVQKLRMARSLHAWKSHLRTFLCLGTAKDRKGWFSTEIYVKSKNNRKIENISSNRQTLAMTGRAWCVRACARACACITVQRCETRSGGQWDPPVYAYVRTLLAELSIFPTRTGGSRWTSRVS